MMSRNIDKRLILNVSVIHRMSQAELQLPDSETDWWNLSFITHPQMLYADMQPQMAITNKLAIRVNLYITVLHMLIS